MRGPKRLADVDGADGRVLFQHFQSSFPVASIVRLKNVKCQNFYDNVSSEHEFVEKLRFPALFFELVCKELCRTNQ